LLNLLVIVDEIWLQVNFVQLVSRIVPMLAPLLRFSSLQSLQW